MPRDRQAPGFKPPARTTQGGGAIDIAIPVATYTPTYGLDEDGHPTIEEEWQSHGDEEVPMLKKTGPLAMAQQTLMMNILGVDDE